MGLPAYKNVYSTLKQEIRDGEYKIGQLLPPEHMLEARFGISRTTVRRALELLSREGYVDSQQGRGTMVLDFSTVQRLNMLTSISETLKNKGFEVSTKSMHIDRIKAGVKIADALKIKEDEFVVRIQRVQCSQGQPIAIMTNYLIEDIAPGIEQYTGTFASLYDFLENKYNVVLTNAIENLSACVADFSESHLLEVPIGSALLVSKRITYSHNKPVEYAILKILGDKYEYSIHMEGRP